MAEGIKGTPADEIHGAFRANAGDVLVGDNPEASDQADLYPLPEGVDTEKVEKWAEWFDGLVVDGDPARRVFTTDDDGVPLAAYELTHHGPVRSALRIERHVKAGNSDRYGGLAFSYVKIADGSYKEEAHPFRRVDEHVKPPRDTGD